MKQFRVGVIGTGFIGKVHIETLRRLGNVDVVALADTNMAAETAEEDELTLTVWDAEAAVITSDRIEVKYVMHMSAAGVRTAAATLVTDAAPVDAPEPARGVALCFPRPGETLWDIAKRYRVPLDTVKSMNPGAEEGGSKGVVVWRRCAAE